MNTFKRFLITIILVLIISATCSSSIESDIKEISVDSNLVELNSEICRLENHSVHHLCFVESGNVRHKNVNCRGFYISAPFNFCIGCVELDLVAFPFEPEEPRLIIKSISGKTIYEDNISVSLKGFIGKVCATGSVFSGFLKGFAFIINITPLDNQWNKKIDYSSNESSEFSSFSISSAIFANFTN